MNILSRLLSLCPKASGVPPAPVGPAAPEPEKGAAGHPVRTTSELLRECVRFVHPSMPMFAAELRDRAAEMEAIGD